MNITKHFVTVGTRRVHYLRAGRGPALAMLHASPCSAKVMRPLLPVFGERFTRFVFDTPGFGLSDKLPIPKPRIEDFADALAETLTALGIEHVAAYGRHTGASIAVEFAARHPQRCAMAYADGYAVFAKPYTDQQLESYLEPIVPAWDGAHLLRLWFRYRDQHVFWPWNVQTAETRSDADVPDLDIVFVDEFDPHVNPLGIKGIGEIGITGVVGSLCNAVYHATGVRVRDLPVTLDKIMMA